MRGLLQAPLIPLKNVAQASTLSGESRPVMRWKSTEPNECERQRDSDWRIMCVNINNFPSERNGFEKMKRDLLKAAMISSEADVIGVSEMGRNENNMDIDNRPSAIMRDWFENGMAMSAWNKDSISTYEPGGTMILSRDRSTAHTIKRGTDSRDLGRWVWITVRGKSERCTTLISAYRPVNSQVTAQNQLNTIRKFNSTIQPEQLWEDDLAELIKTKKEIGEVIVMGDFNDNLNNPNGKVNTFFSSLAMTEALNLRYGDGPPTFTFGSTKIDGIYTTEGITISQGGYGGFSNPPSDHLLPWIDVHESEIVGSPREDRPPPLLRKATSKIPSVKNKFNEEFNKQVMQYSLIDKVKEIHTFAEENGKLTPEYEVMYEKIEERIRRAIKCADSRCRKIRRGKMPFSKKQKELMGKFLY